MLPLLRGKRDEQSRLFLTDGRRPGTSCYRRIKMITTGCPTCSRRMLALSEWRPVTVQLVRRHRTKAKKSQTQNLILKCLRSLGDHRRAILAMMYRASLYLREKAGELHSIGQQKLKDIYHQDTKKKDLSTKYSFTMEKSSAWSPTCSSTQWIRDSVHVRSVNITVIDSLISNSCVADGRG